MFTRFTPLTATLFFIYREARHGHWKEGWAWVNSINYIPLEESNG